MANRRFLPQLLLVTVLMTIFVCKVVNGQDQNHENGIENALEKDIGHDEEHIIENDNSTDNANKTSDVNETTTMKAQPTTVARTTAVKLDEMLPAIGSAEVEHSNSLALFFILVILGLSILLVHLLIKTKFHYLPESIAVVCLGVFLGLVSLLLKTSKIDHDFTQDEILDPNMFFLILLPPIIFESGYSLHKGNFFQNIGSICVFAVFGTIISAMIVGGGVYLLGQAGVAYELKLVESFAFGSLISAVDPVATLAIFSALDVHPLLNMLVFGESILNDAVSIVLSNTVIALNSPALSQASSLEALWYAVSSFCIMFFASAAIGIVVGLISALLLKHIDLRQTPSLEFGLILIFSYLPYVLAEGLKLSGIMAILFTGITMSHYTHYNLSPVTQITVQQTFRTLAFLAETCVFAYLGLALPSFNHQFEPALVIWTIVLILIGRAANIFPLAFLCNKFREHKITARMQFVMWFSGLRGAIAYALSLHLEFSEETRHVLVTCTLVIVLFTILLLGGSTMPLMKLIGAESGKSKKEISLSKTEEMGGTIDTEHLSELTEEEYEVNYVKPDLRGFMKLNTKYLIPFFTRRFTNQEIIDGRVQMRHLANQWYSEVRTHHSDTDDETELVSQEH
ncbi:sodium/hydrogen exchanger 8-like isoform X1 [Amphiura filiformis]|uniref:sodium/hydrogen exchanger 8-like isoform X1 n=1 Tax=Amphiura filiformis TaxID=82378 RepID=UPI003B219122